MPARKTNCTPEERAILDKRLEVTKQWQRDHPEKTVESRRKHTSRILVKLRNREYSGDYHATHREQERAYTKDYHRTHKEVDKAYLEKNKKELQEYRNRWARERYESNPGFRLRKLLSARLSKFLKVFGGTKGSMESIVGCSWEQLRKHIESQFIREMSWDLMGKIHIDHIRPCCSFDLSDPEQQKLCFHFTNLKPLWNVDNQIKGGRY